MYATIPVYYPSLEEAARKDEAALWCDSYNINLSCRNFIQDKAMTAFNTRELDAFIEELVRCYGTERAMYVLSRTIQFSDWDARFDQAVLDRAGKTDFPDTREPREAHQVDPTTRYVTEIDPCVVTAPDSSSWRPTGGRRIPRRVPSTYRRRPRAGSSRSRARRRPTRYAAADSSPAAVRAAHRRRTR